MTASLWVRRVFHSSWALWSVLPIGVGLGCARDYHEGVEPTLKVEPTDVDVSIEVDPAEVEMLRALGYVDVGDPLDAGARTGVLGHDRDRASQGLNLFTNSSACSAQLMDMDGAVVHEWSHEPCSHWGNASLLADGDLVVVGRMPHDPDSREATRRARFMMRLDFDGQVRWKRDFAAHHDVELTPDGQLATLRYSHAVEAEIDPEVPVRNDHLVLADLDGNTTREISLLKLLQAPDSAHTLQVPDAKRVDGELEIDLLHSNAVEFVRHPGLAERSPLFSPGNALICMRHQDAVVIVDTVAERVLFSWGQGELSGPHDATLLANGHILVFDNGLGRRWSRVVEVDPLTREVVWEYRAPEPKSFYTGTRGSSQRLSNGNTLVVESRAARAFEVTPGGDQVWEFVNFNLTDEREPIVIVRMRRYEGLDYEGLRRHVAEGWLEMRD